MNKVVLSIYKMEDSSWIPNWENPDDYPDTEKTSNYQWMWEFLRRNPLYQQLCDKLWKQHLRPPPAEIQTNFGFSVSSSFPHYRENDPTDKEPDGDGESYSLIPIIFKSHGVPILKPEIKDDPEVFEKTIRTNNANLVFPEIDLSLSINLQMKEIKKRLKSMKRGRGLVDKRNQLLKLPIYLRLLDALQADVENNNIRDTLFGKVDNSYPHYSRTERFDDSLQSAIQYQKIDYRYLAQIPVEEWPVTTFVV